jgi:beta-xylosidase
VRRCSLLAAALLVLFAGAIDDVAIAATGPFTWRNPLIGVDFPDPHITRVGEVYWATSTSSAAAPGFPLMRSTDLVTWQPAGTILAKLPAWASGSFWAPEIVIDQAGARVYYSARRKRGSMCVAVATAPSVEGPYTDRGPVICQPAGSIDPTTTRDAYRRLFLVWKEDGNAVRQPSRIWAQRLRPDGLRLIGRPHLLLENRDRWEGSVVEAPSVVVRGGWTYLFYSGNVYDMPRCRYALGVARARSLLRPFHRAPGNPILRTNGQWSCPGHAALFSDDDGREFVFYHSFPAGNSSERHALLDSVTWQANGWPTVSAGVPSEGGMLP